ncbi:hypothetical protein IFR04_011168 [Cadophora malorum]|uniref:CCHC-type domain-containing protein n=1 Tax=Cadophora malorum TaxID=108018 RepID=A0A8H7TA09_9HELO|nr:hypothetical protein IFR04_011168 [Cadophora malorum]
MEPPPPPSSSSDQTRDNAIISGENTATELATIRLRVHRWLDSIPDEAREQSAARLDPSDQQDHDRIPSADGEGEHSSASSVGDVEDGVPEARRSRHHRVIDDSVVNARRRDIDDSVVEARRCRRVIDDSVVNARRQRDIEDSVVEARQRRQQQRDIDDSVVLARQLGIDYAYYPDGELEERYEHNKRPSNGECFICYSRNHRARQCPQNAKTRIPALRDANRGQCFICYGYHLAIHCPNNWINRPGGGGDDSGGVGDLGSLRA